MSSAKNAGRKPGSRRHNKLSKTKSTVRSRREIAHLDVQSAEHPIDVAGTARRRAWEKAEEWEQLPAEAEAELLEALYGDGETDASPGPEPIASGPRPDLATNLWFGDAGVGYPDADGHDGSAEVMEGQAWQGKVMESDRRRAKWRDASGKPRKAEGLELLLGKTKHSWELQFPEKMTGKVGKIFARLPPWTAVAALDQVNRDILVDAVRELAEDFQVETGKRVLAANIHVESSHDIHVHLLFSGLVPEIEEHEYSRTYKDKILRDHREEVRASLIEAGMKKPTMKAINAKLYSLYAAGFLEDPRILNLRLKYRSLPLCRRALKSMGPCYCSKVALWEASGRDERVEAVNARAVRKVSFREIVIQKSWDSQGGPVSSAGIYIDHWLWRRWTSIIESRLDDKTRETLPESAQAYIARYIKDGDSLPNPDLDAARKKAYGDVFMLLATTQQKLAGPDDPPSTAASLPDLIDEIGESMAAKEQFAAKAKLEIREAHVGMESVWQDLAGPEVEPPEVSTVSGWLGEIRATLNQKIKDLTAAVYQRAHEGFFPGEILPERGIPGDLQDELEKKIADERKRLENLAGQVKAEKEGVETLREEVDNLREQAKQDREAAAATLSAAHTAERAAIEKLAPILAKERAATDKDKEIAGRETAVKSAEEDLVKREIRLAGWAKSFKSRLRKLYAGRVSKSNATILGGRLAMQLFKAGHNARGMVRDEVARLRRAEKVLGELLKLPSKAAPDSPAGRLLARAKSILAGNRQTRTTKVAQKPDPTPEG